MKLNFNAKFQSHDANDVYQLWNQNRECGVWSCIMMVVSVHINSASDLVTRQDFQKKIDFIELILQTWKKGIFKLVALNFNGCGEVARRVTVGITEG